MADRSVATAGPALSFASATLSAPFGGGFLRSRFSDRIARVSLVAAAAHGAESYAENVLGVLRGPARPGLVAAQGDTVFDFAQVL